MSGWCQKGHRSGSARLSIWVWVKIKPPRIGPGFGSYFPLTRVPIWGYIFFTHIQIAKERRQQGALNCSMCWALYHAHSSFCHAQDAAFPRTQLCMSWTENSKNNTRTRRGGGGAARPNGTPSVLEFSLGETQKNDLGPLVKYATASGWFDFDQAHPELAELGAAIARQNGYGEARRAKGSPVLGNHQWFMPGFGHFLFNRAGPACLTTGT